MLDHFIVRSFALLTVRFLESNSVVIYLLTAFGGLRSLELLVLLSEDVSAQCAVLNLFLPCLLVGAFLLLR